MSFTDFRKKFVRAIARYGLFSSTWFIKNLSFKGMRWVTRFFIGIGFKFTVRQKRIARESLRIAFKEEKSDEEIDAIFKKCFENVGKGMMELIYFMEHPEHIKDQVTIVGREHIEEALKEGNGVVVVSAHFGNFILMLLKLIKEGYKTNAIIRKTRDPVVEKYFQDKRSRMGLNTIYASPRKVCVDSAIKALRNNEVVFIPLDQNFGSGTGVYVDFFGKKAATATGPVIFAKRTKAPILPMFVVRQEDDTHKIIVEPPMHIEEKDDDKEEVQVNIARITKTIEKYIREYPEEWGWMHRRWKTQPPKQKKEAELNNV